MDTIINYIITFIIGVALTAAFASMRSTSKKVKAISKGVQDLLRGEIIHYYNKYIEKGYCPLHIKQVVEEQYKSYHALGGNGVITNVWEELNELPTEARYKGKADEDDLK